MGRKRLNAGKRKKGHDYRSRCIYHIVLKKSPEFEAFSFIDGIVGSRSDKPRTVRYPAGEIIMRALANLSRTFPYISILRRCVMPDHLHFAIFIKEANLIHLGNAITAIKRYCSEEWEKLGNPPEVKFFIDNYHDTILRGKGQLKKMLDYISDNPRRWLVRRQYRGWFHRFKIRVGDRIYEAHGNWELLSEPEHEAVSIDSEEMTMPKGSKLAVRVSSKFTEEILKEKKWSWVNAVRNDGILVSPFISEDEKKVRDWAVENGGALILLRAEPFGEIYKPQGRYFELCAEGRLLEVHIPVGSGEEEYLRREGKPPRSACLRMNALAEAIASGQAIAPWGRTPGEAITPAEA